MLSARLTPIDDCDLEFLSFLLWFFCCLRLLILSGDELPFLPEVYELLFESRKNTSKILSRWLGVLSLSAGTILDLADLLFDLLQPFLDLLGFPVSLLDFLLLSLLSMQCLLLKILNDSVSLLNLPPELLHSLFIEFDLLFEVA